MAPASTHRVLLGDRRANISFDGDQVYFDGVAVQALFHEISGRLVGVILDGKTYDVFIEEEGEDEYTLVIDDERKHVKIESDRAVLLARYGAINAAQTREKEIRAPMPGLVLNVFVSEGETIESGAALLVLEAMKMENEVRSASAGSVARVHVRAGDAVNKNDLLIEFDD